MPVYKIIASKQDPCCCQLIFQGDWKSIDGLSAKQLLEEMKRKSQHVQTMIIDTSAITAWSSILVALLWDLEKKISAAGLSCTYQPSSSTITDLIQLAQAVPQHHQPLQPPSRFSLQLIGQKALLLYEKGLSSLAFTGSITLSLMRWSKGKRLFKARDFWRIVQECGAHALPIVTLISFLVGLTMAFVGAIQLSAFGASIYVANLVALAMVREMGPMMAGIILCGRTGAAFASHIGSMKVSEEIDALHTLGISPIDFIIVPRVIALFLMMPLLTLYANFVGILGGLVASLMMMDISIVQYLLQTQKAISLVGFSTGIIKSTIFGALIAITGCLKGMECGRSAASVGQAATAAVVTGITALVVADSIFAVIFHVLNI